MEEEAQNSTQPQVEKGATGETENGAIPHSKKGRLIVRNLVFDINEKHVRKLFSKYGEIIDLKLPINPATNKAKGFAFVEFEHKNTALKAINELNDTNFKGRPIYLDLAVEKTRFESNKPAQVEPKKGNENKKKAQDAEDDSDIEQENDDEEDEEDEEDDDEDDDEDDEEDDDEDDDEDNEEDDDEDAAAAAAAAKEKEEEDNANEDFTCTLFVRNISYEVGQSEFRTFFQKFGPVEYAKLVMNRETDTHNGCGFIKYKSSDVAKYIIEQSKKFEGTNPLRKDNTVIADVNFEMGGRRMIVLPAMAKRQVKQVTEERQKNFNENAPKDKNSLEYWIYQDKQHKRQLHLAKLGLNDPEQVDNEIDKEKFAANLAEKVEKVKNPNHFVSKNRIVLKNLPKKYFGEEELKKVVLETLAGKHNAKIIKTRRLVNKTQVIREKERVDEDGNLRSRGYGFVDFADHDDAVFFLEKIQEPANYQKLNQKRIPIVEFAIEDIQEIKKREKILQKVQAKRESEKANGEVKPKFKPQTIEVKNAEKLAKLKLDKLFEQANQGSLQDVKFLMKKIQSRGLKQRYKKKMAQIFNIKEKEKEKPKPKKQVDKSAQLNNSDNSGKSLLQNKKDRKEQEKNRAAKNNNKKAAAAETKPEKPIKVIREADATPEEEAQLVKSLTRMIKNSKRAKRRAEDHDEFDDIAEAYKKKINKQ